MANVFSFSLQRYKDTPKTKMRITFRKVFFLFPNIFHTNILHILLLLLLLYTVYNKFFAASFTFPVGHQRPRLPMLVWSVSFTRPQELLSVVQVFFFALHEEDRTTCGLGRRSLTWMLHVLESIKSGSSKKDGNNTKRRTNDFNGQSAPRIIIISQHTVLTIQRRRRRKNYSYLLSHFVSSFFFIF